MAGFERATIGPRRPAAPWGVRVWARVRRAANKLASVGLAGVLLWLGGCASLPSQAQRTPSSAIADVAATPLARLAAASTPADSARLSGLRLLPDAAPAFELRLALARMAQASLDVQYYLIAQDDSGGQLLAALEQAARRGVRVRLLVDDLHAAASQDALLRLSALPNAEVRLFNPLPSRASDQWAARMLLSLHEFDRVNRRMHNKLFIADNSFAVSGGRNIGNEYAMRSASSHFIDMDLLASGPIVRELSALFDRFWNSEQAYPIEVLAGGQDASRAAAAAPGGSAAAQDPPGGVKAGDALLRELASGRVELHFAPVQLLADAPAKAAVPGGAPLPTAMDGVLQRLGAAQQRIEVVSPYFVPGADGMALLRAAAERRVHVALTTNSLASTDEPMAYLGYARYRDQMLALGVSITELSPAGAPMPGLHTSLSGSVGRLHAKVATIDGRWLLVGSLNMDARSARTNTELVLVVDSPRLAGEMAALLQAHWQHDHYKVRRVPDVAAPDAAQQAAPLEAPGNAPWRTEWVGAGVPDVHHSEPRVSTAQRMWFSVVSLFVPEEWL
ncbi:MAG TPA: phosphatidylserine/phosphatidylglycerophosphate/cardiolipin synthase family protein [Rubrivivax sp.]|nr:phosphatidylserine/phosphatidylglycerophosphate/cardiolipin synthase family protein [Rubrivivax sp.]HPO20130.1 phosphatidylserine/phosphatidylglycerophosphate/cardiolipin synthase family protein [Rubrivivax sp.]